MLNEMKIRIELQKAMSHSVEGIILRNLIGDTEIDIDKLLSLIKFHMPEVIIELNKLEA